VTNFKRVISRESPENIHTSKIGIRSPQPPRSTRNQPEHIRIFQETLFFQIIFGFSLYKEEKKEKEEGKRRRKNKKPNWKQNQIEPVQYDCRENRFGLNGLDEWTRIVNMIDSK